MGTKSLLMAMAALTIAGCSQNEVTEINPDADRTIGLDVYTGVQTRGTETTTSTLKEADAGFGIFAYKTSKEGWDSEKASTTPDFMYNEHATWTSGSWGYASLRFWPTNDDKITFFAYAPYESNPGEGTDQKIILSAQSDKEAPKITFEVKTSNNWKDMVDLVTDCRTTIKDLTSESNVGNKGTVQFKFSHVLTQIANVKVKPDVNLGAETRIFVTGLKLSPGSGILYNKAVYDFGTDAWNAISPSASYFSAEQDLSEFVNRTGIDQWGYKKSAVDVSSNTDATALFSEKEALYFIPVNNQNGTAKEGDLSLKISYDVVTKVNDSSNLTSTVTDKEVKLPQGTFKKGTQHTYVLTIKMNAISIAVDDNMTGWRILPYRILCITSLWKNNRMREHGLIVRSSFGRTIPPRIKSVSLLMPLT